MRGAEFCRAYSGHVDDWLKELFESAGGDCCSVALTAVGGYGREELSPQSDLDVLLIHDSTNGIEDLAVGIWHPIWDEGLKLGHAVRTITETLELSRHSLDTATSLLSLRFLAGDAEMAELTKQSAEHQWRAGAEVWLPRLVADSRKRGRRNGALAFRLQPDLKDSTGGMRDMQALGFAALAKPDLMVSNTPLPDEAYESILAARVELHRVSGRSNNLLTLEMQDDVASALGYSGAEELMTEVSSAGRTAAWVVDNTWSRIENWSRPRLWQFHGRLEELFEGVFFDGDEIVISSDVGVGDAFTALRIAVAAAERDARIELKSLQRLRDVRPMGDTWPADGRELFVRLLASGRSAIPVIESLEQVGAMVKILPEWESCQGLLQRNDYHRFTVDRHLCEAAAEASALIARGDEIDRPDLLLVGAFLHDIGKGYEGDHSKVGMALVERIAGRMGFGEEDAATLSKLVELHLLLPDVATRRNIEEVGTVLRVAAKVGNVSVLRLLAALTEADSVATGPSVWSSWKATLIRGLVSRTEHYLLGGELSELPKSFPTQEVLDRMSTGRQHLTAGGQMILTITPQDAAALPTLAGVLTLNGLGVLSAMLYTECGMTAQLARVDTPGQDDAVWGKVLDNFKAALDGRLALADRLSRLTRTAWTSAPQPAAPQPVVGSFIRFDNDTSTTCTVLELAAPDSMGLLFRITSALVSTGLRIERARVQTLGDHVVDSFDVTDAEGTKITEAARLEEIARLVEPVIRDAPRHQRVRREDAAET